MWGLVTCLVKARVKGNCRVLTLLRRMATTAPDPNSILAPLRLAVQEQVSVVSRVLRD